MTRDRREPSGPDPAGDGARGGAEAADVTGHASDELLTAYVDGVTELAPEDRRRVEARLASDPGARAEQAAVRTLLERLRSASGRAGDGSAQPAEPDWAAMERSIRLAVGPEVPRSWWRRWRWLAPTATFASAATVMALMWARPTQRAAPELTAGPGGASHPMLASHPVPDPGARDAPPPDDIVPLWLDGDEVDVELSASELLGDTGAGDDAADRASAADEVGLLPATDLAWVDHLDDAALDRAERWLAGKKS